MASFRDAAPRHSAGTSFEKLEVFVDGHHDSSYNSVVYTYTPIIMASNVLPFFWDLASSSKSTRLDASANLVSSLQTFQSAYTSQTNGSTLEDTEAEDEEDSEDDEDDDEESGEEVDASEDEDENAESNAEAKRLDKQLGKSNAEDVVYSVKRLVRGLASSRESSRLGFAVALTEVRKRRAHAKADTDGLAVV